MVLATACLPGGGICDGVICTECRVMKTRERHLIMTIGRCARSVVCRHRESGVVARAIIERRRHCARKKKKKSHCEGWSFRGWCCPGKPGTKYVPRYLRYLGSSKLQRIVAALRRYTVQEPPSWPTGLPLNSRSGVWRPRHLRGQKVVFLASPPGQPQSGAAQISLFCLSKVPF